MIGYYQLYLGSNGEVDIVPVMPVLLVNTRRAVVTDLTTVQSSFLYIKI